MSLLGIFGTIGRSAILPATTHRAERTVDLVNALFANMADDKKEPEEEEELLDYEEEEEAPADAGAKGGDAAVKKGYVGIHSTGFRDFLLKPELLRAIVDCGFEHPSEGARGVRPADVRPGRSRRLLAHFLNFGAQFDAATKPAAHAGGPTRILPRRDRECPIASKRLSRGGDIESAGGISLSPAVPRR